MSVGVQRTSGDECEKREDEDKERVEAAHSWRQRSEEESRREREGEERKEWESCWDEVVYKVQGIRREEVKMVKEEAMYRNVESVSHFTLLPGEGRKGT